jgi:folate-binding protein YgfZ
MLCNLPDAGLIRFSGDDAQTFLHNQLTCDVAALEAGRSTYGAYCTPKGRMLASFLMWRTESAYFMQLPAALREPIQKQLAKFILRSKVKTEDATGEWVLLGASEADAAALAQRATGKVPTSPHEATLAPGVTAIRLPGDRCEVVVRWDKAAAVVESGWQNAGPEYWEWLDIRAGIPVITPATQEEFVPQMVNLDLIGGVSFEKGCYPGQEIVARMHYRGTLKQRMYRASISGSGAPQPGDKLYSPDFGEQACGTIVNAALAPGGGHEVLASIQIVAADQSGVHWKSLQGPTLNLLPLPYAAPAPT